MVERIDVVKTPARRLAKSAAVILPVVDGLAMVVVRQMDISFNRHRFYHFIKRVYREATGQTSNSQPHIV